jgi:hypothetical protein
VAVCAQFSTGVITKLKDRNASDNPEITLDTRPKESVRFDEDARCSAF